ncbi:universal stress protein [Streptomyces sp. NPDC094149]|uniref:universal stress protein n=1 Tax=Streptomyces sp. NPDC094149 TaxID=3155079 RepID=UPI00332BC503
MTHERESLWDYGRYAPRPALHGHVLAGVDGSDEALRALDQAVAEAVARRAPLEILHGWPWAKHGTHEGLPGGPGQETSSLLERAHAVLESAVARVREQAPELDVTATLTPHPAAAELMRRGEHAALTVIGSRGPSEITGLVSGSVGRRLAGCCPSPLLVVRGEAAYGGLEHGVVLVGVGTDTETEAARFAFEEAQQRGARVRVLHSCVLPATSGAGPVVSAERLRAELETKARKQSAVPRTAVTALREKFPGVGVETDTVWGGAAESLVEATRAADAVVITAHRPHGRGPAPRLGPVTHALLHRAHCPVYLVPAG